MAGRSTMVRTLCRASSNLNLLARGASFSLRTSNFTPRRNPIAPARLFRRELSSFEPLHSAIASAYLVSKLPSEATTSIQVVGNNGKWHKSPGSHGKGTCSFMRANCERPNFPSE